MIARIGSVAFDGLLTKYVDVQVSITTGLPSFTIVGLADKAVSESKERLRSAFQNLGLSLPNQRITINLSPADLNKEGSHFDLPIALALLASMNIIPREEILNYVAIGEISLDGKIKEVNGCLATSLFATQNNYGFIFPIKQLNEMYLVKGQIDLLPIANLLDIIDHFNGKKIINSNNLEIVEQIQVPQKFVDIGSIRGQESAKIALEICAAGMHNLLMIGPPGSGKSMLANALGGILPPLTKQEALEVSLIYSIAGELGDKSLITQRPFRSPHHSASAPALVGGGRFAKPGEITLAHNGVLFLDELPEFPQNILDTLRQPIENGIINISRVNSNHTYPAKFQFIAAMNPCKCGYFGDKDRSCTKAPVCAQNYMSKISGPIMDRIDLVLDVPPVSMDELNQVADKNLLYRVKERVLQAREIQANRYKNYNILTNSQASADVLDETAKLDKDAKDLLQTSIERFKLSTRAYFRLLRVSRTIADLGQSASINKNHVSQAIFYRKL